MSEPSATPSAQGARPSKKAKKRLLLGAAGAVPLLGAGVVFFVLPGADAKEAAVHVKPGALTLEPCVVNLSDAEGDRFLKCALRVAVESEEAAERLQGDDLILLRIQDAVLSVLSSLSTQDLASSRGREALRKALLLRIERVLGDTRVLDVYFTELLFQ